MDDETKEQNLKLWASLRMAMRNVEAQLGFIPTDADLEAAGLPTGGDAAT